MAAIDAGSARLAAIDAGSKRCNRRDEANGLRFNDPGRTNLGVCVVGSAADAQTDGSSLSAGKPLAAAIASPPRARFASPWYPAWSDSTVIAPAGFFADSAAISPALAAAAGPLHGFCDDSAFAAALQTVHRPFACTRNDGDVQPGTQHPGDLLLLPCAPAVNYRHDSADAVSTRYQRGADRVVSRRHRVGGPAVHDRHDSAGRMHAAERSACSPRRTSPGVHCNYSGGLCGTWWAHRCRFEVQSAV